MGPAPFRRRSGSSYLAGSSDCSVHTDSGCTAPLDASGYPACCGCARDRDLANASDRDGSDNDVGDMEKTGAGMSLSDIVGLVVFAVLLALYAKAVGRF